MAVVRRVGLLVAAALPSLPVTLLGALLLRIAGSPACATLAAGRTIGIEWMVERCTARPSRCSVL